MISRENLLEQLNNNQLSLDLFWDYYIVKCKEPKSQEEFISKFPTYLHLNPGVVNGFIDYLCREFSILKVLDKEDKLLKYV